MKFLAALFSNLVIVGLCGSVGAVAGIGFSDPLVGCFTAGVVSSGTILIVGYFLMQEGV